MKAPAGLVGAALGLWGFSIGLPWLGAAAGLGFETMRWAAPAPSARAARRLAPLVRACALLAVASLVGLMVAQGAPQALYSWLRWLPLMLLPLPVLQLWVERITVQGLLRAWRREVVPEREGGESKGEGEGDEVDFTHAQAALTLAAAGTGSSAAAWLYPGLVLIVGWALLARQPRGRRVLAGAMVAAASAVGYGAHMGISVLQGQVEDLSTDLIADWLAPPPDPFRERTRIGDLGKIKLSDRIVMRVVVEEPRPEALLLRESAFDRYRGGEWQSARRAVRPAVRASVAGSTEAADRAHAGVEDRWLLGEGAAADSSSSGPSGSSDPSRPSPPSPSSRLSHLSLRRSLPGGEGLLPLPLGTRSVAALPARAVEVLATGAVRVHGTPRFIAIDVAYDPAAEAGAPDLAIDLEVPALLGPTLARVIDEERLRQASAAATVDSVRGFFTAKFAYSLELGDARRGDRGRTLADFLLRERKGHCEYFATATVLLLRQAGIPARYVGGYSAQEYSARERAFVVRARHAHAWAQAWVDGRWINVDTTPSRWAEFEDQAARSAFGPALDLFSWLVDRALQAWQALSGEGLAALAMALLGAVLVVPALRFAVRALRRRRRREADAGRPDALAQAWAQVERSVAAAGHAREPGETVRAWARRLDAGGDQPAWRASLPALAETYYRVRFDPAVPADLRGEFLVAARRWATEAPAAPRLR